MAGHGDQRTLYINLDEFHFPHKNSFIWANWFTNITDSSVIYNDTLPTLLMFTFSTTACGTNLVTSPLKRAISTSKKWKNTVQKVLRTLLWVQLAIHISQLKLIFKIALKPRSTAVAFCSLKKLTHQNLQTQHLIDDLMMIVHSLF